MRLAIVAATLVLLASAPSRADRPAESEGRAATRPAPGVGGGGAGAPALRVPGLPPPPADNAELREALERARPEMQACLDAALARGATVRARISRDAALRLTVRTRPRRDTDVEGCIDLAARRHVTPLLGRPIRRALSASVRLGVSGPRPPVPPPVPPPAGDAREVHDRLDASAGSLRRCLDEAFPGMTGTVTLRVVAHRDGSMVLEGAGLPPGVPAGPMLVCLQNEVAHLRVSAGGERSASHDLTLGR